MHRAGHSRLPRALTSVLLGRTQPAIGYFLLVFFPFHLLLLKRDTRGSHQSRLNKEQALNLLEVCRAEVSHQQRTSIPPQHASCCSSLRLAPKAARPSLLAFEAGQKLFPELPIIRPVSNRQEYRSHHQPWETDANMLDFPLSRFSFWFF